jgi:NOL1/NOP2/sun family putative RNA methylase
MPRRAGSQRGGRRRTASRRPQRDAPATAETIPPGFRDRIEAMLGAESDAFFAALLEPAAGLRVNTLRLTAAEFAAISPFALAPLPYPAAGFRVDPDARPGKHPYHDAGLYYLQDPGAMAVAAMLDPQPGERVIDLAAAPGGKATHLAALMRDEGVLIANDVQPSRTRELIGNLERCGVRCAVVTLESVARLADRFGAWFDRVLLDAPCSGEAMFHKSAAARSGWSPAAVAGCARRQIDLLHDAAALVRPGGRLVYSTCTFSPEEDEQVIARFLQDERDFELIELPEVPGALPGRPEWVPAGIRHPALARTVRLWPHRVAGAGHFVAGLRRMHGSEPAAAPATATPLPHAARELWETFRAAAISRDRLPAGTLELRGQELYLVPAAAPDVQRLRVERPGWWLGTVLKGRFEPSHAMALALTPETVGNRVDLQADDPRVHAYLQGETLSVAGDPGWVQVAVEGFALGWAKRVGSTLKNHLPKGLRGKSVPPS